MRNARALAALGVLGVAILVTTTAPIAAPARAQVFPTAAPLDASIDEGATVGPTTAPDVRELTFSSAALARTMPYSVYLPPDYATSAKRYPVLYMLHGMSGTNVEWQSYGLFDRADAMIRAGTLQPLIIVLPQGDTAYWVDHAVTDKLAWGRYMAQDVVGDVDARFRTISDSAHRAIGGVSMGA